MSAGQAIKTAAVFVWTNKGWFAFVAGYFGSGIFTNLPDPDNPADWKPGGAFDWYRLFYKSARTLLNVKPKYIPIPPTAPLEVLPPKL